MAFSTEFYLRAVAESRYLAKTHLRCISSLPRVADYNTRERRWDELKKKKKKMFCTCFGIHSRSPVISFYPLIDISRETTANRQFR